MQGKRNKKSGCEGFNYLKEIIKIPTKNFHSALLKVQFFDVYILHFTWNIIVCMYIKCCEIEYKYVMLKMFLFLEHLLRGETKIDFNIKFRKIS